MQFKRHQDDSAKNLYTEIRNRIYDYAVEDKSFRFLCNGPPTVNRHVRGCGRSAWPLDPQEHSERQFLGLTQTCKQLRTEYRPIWLRNSRVRVTHDNLRAYIHTFYGCATRYTDMPRLIQISYDHDLVQMIDVSLLLRISANCRTTQVELIPHVLTQKVGPWTDDEECPICKWELEEGMEEAHEDGCPHLEERFEDYLDYIQDEEYLYLASLNFFLAHNNSNWLEDIRDYTVDGVKIVIEDGVAYEVWIQVCDDCKMAQKKQRGENMAEIIDEYVQTRGLASEAVQIGIRRDPTFQM